MTKKITDICEEIVAQQLTDAEREMNSSRALAQKLNALLIQKQDLTTCALGKIETDQGAFHGICGELRTKEDGSRYWLPLYSERGYQYVLRLFRENRNSLIDTPAVPESPVRYRNTRTERRKQIEQHGSLYRVYLLEGPGQYWLFDEDADFLGEKFNLRVNNTARGKRNLKYNTEYHDEIIKILRRLNISYYVVHPDTEEGFAPIQPVANAVSYGMKFTLRDQEDEIQSFVILEEGATTIITVDRPDGTIEIISKPIEMIGSLQRLSPESALAQAMEGAKIGERRMCNGRAYTVQNILPFDENESE